jgi:hypothetical protein
VALAIVGLRDALSRLADEDMLHAIDYVRVPAPTVSYFL